VILRRDTLRDDITRRRQLYAFAPAERDITPRQRVDDASSIAARARRCQRVLMLPGAEIILRADGMPPLRAVGA